MPTFNMKSEGQQRVERLLAGLEAERNQFRNRAKDLQAALDERNGAYERIRLENERLMDEGHRLRSEIRELDEIIVRTRLALDPPRPDIVGVAIQAGDPVSFTTKAVQVSRARLDPRD